MRGRVVGLAVGAGVLGLAAEWVAFAPSDIRQWLPDLVVGWTFVGCGLVALVRRPDSRTGALLAGTGVAWFLGNFAAADPPLVAWLAGQLTYLHRAVVIHAVLSYPTGRLSAWADRVFVAAAYATAVVVPLARDDVVTVLLGGALIAVAGWDVRRTVGSVRRARADAFGVAVLLGAALVLTGLVRQLVVGPAVDQVVLVGYQAALCAVAVTLLIGLLREPSRRAAVADLVVELTGSPTGTLREALARTLGDPTIEVGYWLPTDGGYVDARGEPLALPQGRHDRAVSPIDIDGRRVGVIVHDPAIGSDEGLMDAIAVAAELASANARLQAEVRAQVADVEASRRRLVDAGDEQRRRLQHRLRAGALQRLDAVADTLAEARALAEQQASARTAVDQLTAAQQQLRRTVADVDELARGLHPPALEESGLAVALSELVERSAVPVELRVDDGRLPRELEAAVYFVCAEALANIGKHAAASHGAVNVTTGDRHVVITVEDDGAGGAVFDQGTGLQGLADRVQALGGTLKVDSPAREGTHLTAELPLDAGGVSSRVRGDERR